MNRKVVDFAHTRARALGLHLLKHMRNGRGETHGGDWQGYKGEPLEWEIYDGNSILFRRSEPHLRNAAQIRFKGISPKDITREVLHDPQQIGGTTVDAHSTDFYNDTSVEQTRIYSVEIGEEYTQADDIGVSVTLGFQQQISAGGELAFSKFVATFSQSVTSNYNKHMESTRRKTTKTETEIVIPPRKKVTVTTERKIGNLEQKLEYWCDIDYAIEVWSHNDFFAKWSSTGDLKQMLRGLGEISGDAPEDTYYTTKFYKDIGGIPEHSIDKFFPGEELHFEHTTKFDKATTGSVRVLESDL